MPDHQLPARRPARSTIALLVVAGAGTSGVASARPVHAQAAQAVQNLPDAVESQRRAAVARVLAVLDRGRTGSAAIARAGGDLEDALRRASEAAERTLEVPRGAAGAAVLEARLRELRRTMDEVETRTAARAANFAPASADATELDALLEDLRAARSGIVPALFGPAVNFTLGYNATRAASGRRGWAQDVELGTNLVGAVAGAVFGALADAKLGTYLKQNLAVNVGIPTVRGRRITSTAGIALGELPAGKVVVWPTLAMTQMDTADRRIPAELGRSVPDQATWSAPALTLGVLYTENLGCVREGKCFPPVLVLGATVPQYYPGNPYAAIAALFGDDREKYRQTGGWRLTAGLAVPLRGLTRQPQ
ncbi:hypothetical protein [Roseisolibacter sp. H3M3-2]|uniref:hypothetical protein n=1 Tax=Roseisolibacter sp. H3M3-2 TaxID=3031323 RepID=UPI0023DA92BA|nr:hypothetical protein [Roseisolibacter sp. H3M3-2]MDF1502436.1 hypothetical protein [Roseisolibacter sp. H3M3-2]